MTYKIILTKAFKASMKINQEVELSIDSSIAQARQKALVLQRDLMRGIDASGNSETAWVEAAIWREGSLLCATDAVTPNDQYKTIHWHRF